MKMPKLMKIEIVVQLKDSFYNPVLLRQLRLNLKTSSTINSGFSIWMFMDNNNELFMVYYLAKMLARTSRVG